MSKIDKNTAAIVIALITALSGLGTAIINRYTPNELAVEESEKKGKVSYKVLKSALKNVSEDVDVNAKRIDMLEHTIALQNRTIQFLLPDAGVHPTTGPVPSLPSNPQTFKSKRTPTRMRGAVPDYETAQRKAEAK